MSDADVLIDFPEPRGDLPFTGERFIPGVSGQLRFEHYHRYLFARRFVAGREVLDVACGEGYGTVVLSQIAKAATGVDIAEDIITRARELYGSATCRFLPGPVQNIPLSDACMDVVVSFETIEHVTQQPESIREFRRVLRSDGLLMISTPNAAADDGAAHEANHFHEKELTRDELLALLRKEFKNVLLCEQTFLHGSLIGPPSQHARGEPELFKSKSVSQFACSRGGIGDSYFIALASDAELPEVGWSALDSVDDFVKVTQDLGFAVGEMRRYEATLAQLQRELAEAKRSEALAQIQTEHLRRRLAKQTTLDEDEAQRPTAP